MPYLISKQSSGVTHRGTTLTYAERPPYPYLSTKHFVVAIGLLFLLVTSACKSVSYECKVMRDCCEVIKDEEGVGIACSKKMLDGVEDSSSCVSVVQSIQAMFEEKGPSRHLPEQCILRDK